MGWQEAGIAWSARARDWAYFMEPVFLPLYEQLAVALDVGPGTNVLDVGCGASLCGITRSGVQTSSELMPQLGC